MIEQEKKNTTGKAKRTLLQTYFVSLASLVLCVGMFLMTTYAWFTSEVNNPTNEIYIGVLDVSLLKEATPEPLDLAVSGNKLFNENIRWEPGHTTVETVHVVNKGDLAFRYAMTFTDGKLNGQVDPRLLEVAQWFDVWVYHDEANTIPTVTDFETITAENSGWQHAGTLAQILSGQPVFTGVMTNVRQAGQAAENINENTTDGVASKATYTIALRMNPDADMTVMGQRISLSVKLVAYQASSEEDAFGPQYDRIVMTAGDLQEAFRDGGRVLLAADIAAKDVVTLAEVPKGKEVELFLNGHTITAQLADPDSRSTELFYVHTGGKLTVHGDEASAIHVKAGKSLNLVSAVINNCGGTVVLNGGNYTMEYGSYAQGYLAPLIVDNNSTTGAATLTVNGGTFTHTRNMFRNFANHGTQVATIRINGGSFSGTASDAGAIWNQKTSGSIPAGAGVVVLNGGTFTDMTVCTGFADADNKPTGVTLSGGMSLGQWMPDGAEWIAEILSPAAVG